MTAGSFGQDVEVEFPSKWLYLPGWFYLSSHCWTESKQQFQACSNFFLAKQVALHYTTVRDTLGCSFKIALRLASLPRLLYKYNCYKDYMRNHIYMNNLQMFWYPQIKHTHLNTIPKLCKYNTKGNRHKLIQIWWTVSPILFQFLFPRPKLFAPDSKGDVTGHISQMPFSDILLEN